MTPRRKGAECSWGREKVGLQRTQEGTTGSTDEDLFLEGANSPLPSQKRKEKPAVNYMLRIPSALEITGGQRQHTPSDAYNLIFRTLKPTQWAQSCISISKHCIFKSLGGVFFLQPRGIIYASVYRRRCHHLTFLSFCCHPEYSNQYQTCFWLPALVYFLSCVVLASLESERLFALLTKLL